MNPFPMNKKKDVFNLNNIIQKNKIINNNLNPNKSMFNLNNNMFNQNNNMFNPYNNMFNQNNNMNNFAMNPNRSSYLNSNMQINSYKNNMNININNDNFQVNKGVNVNNFTLPSNLKGRVKLKAKNNNEYLEMRFLLNNNDYILDIVKKDEKNCIYFICKLKEDITLLYEYSCIKTFEELKNLNHHFQGCDNINEIFSVLKNIFMEVKYKTKTKPRIDLMNDMVVLYFICPTLSGKYEDTTIFLQKVNRNIEKQFSKLQFEYIQLNYNFKEIQKIAWSIGDKNDIKLQKIQEICGLPDNDGNCF